MLECKSTPALKSRTTAGIESFLRDQLWDSSEACLVSTTI